MHSQITRNNSNSPQLRSTWMPCYREVKEKHLDPKPPEMSTFSHLMPFRPIKINSNNNSKRLTQIPSPTLVLPTSLYHQAPTKCNNNKTTTRQLLLSSPIRWVTKLSSRRWCRTRWWPWCSSTSKPIWWCSNSSSNKWWCKVKILSPRTCSQTPSWPTLTWTRITTTTHSWHSQINSNSNNPVNSIWTWGSSNSRTPSTICESSFKR